MRFSLTLLLITSAFLFFGCTKEQGCINPEACNFSQSAEEDDGSCYLPGEECDDGIDTTILDQYTNTCQCEGVDPSFGCTDDTACNYSASANTDDGSCEYITCAGCMDIDACNYDSEATLSTGDCDYPGDNCDDGNSATLNDFWSNSCSCTGELLGCTSTSACNYNSDADLNDGSCYFIGDSCDDGDSDTLNDSWSYSCSCTGELPGCTSTSACNYNSEADIDDNSCAFVGDSCDDGNSNTISDYWHVDCDCYGSDVSNQCAYDWQGSPNYLVYIGFYADEYADENTAYLYSASSWTNGGSSITGGTGYNSSGLNQWYYPFGGVGPGDYTLVITDSYGDGILSPGYYYAYCLNVAGNEVPLVPNTPWDTGNPKNPGTPISTTVTFHIN